jgi:hypothetical protein
MTTTPHPLASVSSSGLQDGSSCFFYAAEFEGLPADAGFQRVLCRAMADLVNGRTQRRLPGAEPGLLHGSPLEGGFGLLPVTEHVCV